ncbi:MAG: hypothetical protein R3F48_00310 [Candidatus Zixiibacteriota bacterium]
MLQACVRFILTIGVLLLATGAARAGWSIDLEGGLASSGYNDVRIPGSTGTKFSLSEELDAESTPFYRVRLIIGLGKRHSLSFLAAPFQFESSGTLDRDIDFNGMRFDAGVPLKSNYRFDSYRVSYQYTWLDNENLRAGIGFTGKIRDAAIKLSNGLVASEKTNTGFVPLINFAFDWRVGSRVGILFEGDALAAPQGRAEDVLLAVYINATDRIRLRAGYRILEGGADNDEVYTFALVHYASAGVTLRF